MSANASLLSVIRIKPTERAVIVGKTGSGKTTLATALVNTYHHVFAWDIKGELDLLGAHEVKDPQELESKKVRDWDRIVYRPEPEFDTEDWNEAVLAWVYDRKNTTLYIDEIYALMRRSQAPEWYRAILTRGRSRRIRTISCTQRPAWIPLAVLSEAEHYVCFELNLLEDRKRMAALMGEEVMQEPEEYSFWYSNSKQKPKLYRLNLKKEPAYAVQE